MKSLRVRFAPSPTGYLHIGNARTALFNYLFACQDGGSLVLRIEDTDPTRSSSDFEKAIFEDLRWLSIRWDEGPDTGGKYGPYRQSLRQGLYREYAEELLRKGKVYKCFCSPEELEQMRKSLLARSQMPRYDGRCRNLSPREVERFEEEGRRSTLRFKVEGTSIPFGDMIHGELSFEAGSIGDFVILRSDGMAAYNFACVIDDAAMKISHVIRGDDHLPNTPKQLLLYEALGVVPPQFAHHPLILGADRTPLSKRHGDTAVRHYREKGYLAEALNNYLVLLGWTPHKGKEILSIVELTEAFRLEKLSRGAPVFDLKKLQWVNSQHMRNASVESLSQLVVPFLPEKTVLGEARLHRVIRAVRDNLQNLSQIKNHVELFTDQPVAMDPEALETLNTSKAVEVISEMRDLLRGCDRITEETCYRLLEELRHKFRIGAKGLMMPLRAAITGKTHGPELVKILALLDRETILRRLDHALEGRK